MEISKHIEYKPSNSVQRGASNDCCVATLSDVGHRFKVHFGDDPGP